MWIKPLLDMHTHLRQGVLLQNTLHHNLKHREYIVAMPNLKQPILNINDLEIYRKQIQDTIIFNSKYHNHGCKILYTIYLTRQLENHIDQFQEWKQRGCFAFKLYPKGMTTNSDYGLSQDDLVSSWFANVLKGMNKAGIFLLCHGEAPNQNCMEAEDRFHFYLWKFRKYIDANKIVMEHITSAKSIEMALCYGYGATITAHHLRLTIDDVVGQPNNYCKPVAKYDVDRRMLIQTIADGHPNFFLGSDSAPHLKEDKFQIHKKCCAGCFTAPYLIPLLLETFEQNNIMTKFENFTRNNAARFYELELNSEPKQIEVVKESMQIPLEIDNVVPFMADQTLSWNIVSY